MAFTNINRVVLIGRLTRDPELRVTPTGTSVCSLRLACNSVRRGEEGEYQQRPNFFDVSVFGSSAENVSRFMAKGSRVAVDGRLQWREWETSDQQRRQSVSVIADTVEFLDSPGAWRDGDAPQPEGSQSEGDQPEGAEHGAAEEAALAGVGADGDDFAF